ncbi:MAG TPA: hypothetical protein VFW69_08685 [Mycobacterium sp.]|nr:hypothetical protein [Mycobacterium sp.]
MHIDTRRLIGAIERAGNPILNAITVPILESRWSWLLQRFVVTISYTGRRSGNSFSTPVLYSKHDDIITIRVASPDSKKWWRNFLDDGAPITVHLAGATRTGYATSRRADRGRVIVHVALDPWSTS